MRAILAGAWLHTDWEGLHGRFVLRVSDDVLAGRLPAEMSLIVDCLPDPDGRCSSQAKVRYLPEPGRTEPQTFLNRTLFAGVPIPPLEVEIAA